MLHSTTAEKKSAQVNPQKLLVTTYEESQTTNKVTFMLKSALHKTLCIKTKHTK